MSEVRRFLETSTLSHNPNFLAAPLLFAQTLTDFASLDKQNIPAADVVVLLQVKQREGIERWQRGLEFLLRASEGTTRRQSGPRVT